MGPRGPPAWAPGDQPRPPRARPGGGTGRRQGVRKGRTRRRVAIGLDRLLWYATLAGMERRSDHASSLLITSGIAMHLESTIADRVETFVRHPVFAGSDQAMDLVLDDLEAMERSGQIGQATYRRLREMILRSPHIVSCR